MNFNEISIKVEPEDFSYLESDSGAVDSVDMGLGSVMGSVKTEVPDIEIKHEPIEDLGDSASRAPVKVFECPNCPQEMTSLNR